MSPSKRCPRCGEEKPLDGFYVDRRTKTGRTVYCKPCNRAIASNYKQKNIDVVRQRSREAATTEEGRAKARARYWRNPEHYRAKALRNKNLALAADAEARRRAKIRGAERIEKVDRLAIYDRDGGVCHICEKPVDRDEFHLDHLIPIARGGTHTVDNVAAAHRECNQRRGAGRIPAQLLLFGEAA